MILSAIERKFVMALFTVDVSKEGARSELNRLPIATGARGAEGKKKLNM